MLPEPPAQNIRNHSSADAEFSGKHRHCVMIRDIPGSNLSNIFFRQLGASILLSPRNAFWVESGTAPVTPCGYPLHYRGMFFSTGCPTLSHLIRHIIEIRPLKKVRWIAARRIIAGVENLKRCVENRIANLKGDSMGHPMLSFCAYMAVSLAIFACLPNPAFIRPAPVNLAPKSSDVFFVECEHKKSRTIRPGMHAALPAHAEIGKSLRVSGQTASHEDAKKTEESKA